MALQQLVINRYPRVDHSDTQWQPIAAASGHSHLLLGALSHHCSCFNNLSGSIIDIIIVINFTSVIVNGVIIGAIGFRCLNWLNGLEPLSYYL